MQAEIKGTTMPLLEMLLDPGEVLVSTHSQLSWMTPNVEMTQSTSTGGQKGLMSGFKRVVGGGGIFLTRYQATAGQGMVAFGAKLPGRIFPVDVAPDHGYLVHQHGWVCGSEGIVPSVGLQQTFRGGMWGGEGFILQRLEGQGQAWIELSGEIATYELAAGQTILVHPGHVGLFEDRVAFDVRLLKGLKNKVFGGDGIFLVALTGPGNVWLQSMPLPVLAHALAPYLTTEGSGPTTTTSPLGGAINSLFGS
jgi:uncharacterized protein (TIGR00266 family)